MHIEPINVQEYLEASKGDKLINEDMAHCDINIDYKSREGHVLLVTS